MGKKLTVCFAVIILFSALFAALSFAQVDPEKALIGVWEGQAGSSIQRADACCDKRKGHWRS